MGLNLERIVMGFVSEIHVHSECGSRYLRVKLVSQVEESVIVL